MNKEVILPSGAKLEITPAPFVDAKALYQAMLEEVAKLKLDPKTEIDVNFYKDIFCVGFSSKKVEAALEVCLKRVTYNGLKISVDTFEPVEARDDYMTACFEVAKENVSPFMKSLYVKYSHLLETVKNLQT